jgi:meiotically up-regulated gene 157 (Mug157) protein
MQSELEYIAAIHFLEWMDQKLKGFPEIAPVFNQCYLNTLETTVEKLANGNTFIITGDIPAMWLRDSTAQVHVYLPLAAEDAGLANLLKGLIRQQASSLMIDPYANAFNRSANGNHNSNDFTEMGSWVWERKFELDSLCYPVQLLHDYWKTSGDESLFDETIYAMLKRVIEVMLIEQHHDQYSRYSFMRHDDERPLDTLLCEGHGRPTNYTGMVWSGFRPSDDACTFGYHIPSNMFAVVVLDYVEEIAQKFYNDPQLALQAHNLRISIDKGIQDYGIVEHPRFGKLYAYETDGFGNSLLMDDANVPSLLSIPYLGYRPTSDPIYQNTRAFVLSSENPYYVSGKFAGGIGSPHTGPGTLWPISLMIQGLTSTDTAEQLSLLQTLVATTAGTNYMHESFSPDNPSQFTRAWFAWANSLFSEYVIKLVKEKVLTER